MHHLGELMRQCRRQESDMKRRIAVWAGLGFVVACCWLLYVFLTPRDHLNANLTQPAVQALIYVSCPIVGAGRYFNVPLSLWTVAVVNALTYAAIGTIVETLRRTLKPTAAV
jgi:hypothetical protein